MSEQSKKMKVLVVDGVNASSVAKLLENNGIECKIINEEDMASIDREKVFNLDKMIDSRIGYLNVLNKSSSIDRFKKK